MGDSCPVTPVGYHGMCLLPARFWHPFVGFSFVILWSHIYPLPQIDPVSACVDNQYQYLSHLYATHSRQLCCDPTFVTLVHPHTLLSQTGSVVSLLPVCHLLELHVSSLGWFEGKYPLRQICGWLPELGVPLHVGPD